MAKASFGNLTPARKRRGSFYEPMGGALAVVFVYGAADWQRVHEATGRFQDLCVSRTKDYDISDPVHDIWQSRLLVLDIWIKASHSLKAYFARAFLCFPWLFVNFELQQLPAMVGYLTIGNVGSHLSRAVASIDNPKSKNSQQSP